MIGKKALHEIKIEESNENECIITWILYQIIIFI